MAGYVGFPGAPRVQAPGFGQDMHAPAGVRTARGSVIQIFAIFATGTPVTGAVTGSITPTAAPDSTDPVRLGIPEMILATSRPHPGQVFGTGGHDLPLFERAYGLDRGSFPINASSPSAKVPRQLR